MGDPGNYLTPLHMPADVYRVFRYLVAKKGQATENRSAHKALVEALKQQAQAPFRAS